MCLQPYIHEYLKMAPFILYTPPPVLCDSYTSPFFSKSSIKTHYFDPLQHHFACICLLYLICYRNMLEILSAGRSAPSVGLSVFFMNFWAAAPKGTKSCRTKGDFCSSVRSLVPPVPDICPLRPEICPLRPSPSLNLPSQIQGLRG